MFDHTMDTVPPERLPIQPGRTSESPVRCPWGCDLRIATATTSWSHWYQAPERTCGACRQVPGAGGPGHGTWVTIDTSVSHQKPAGEVDGLTLSLIVTPPNVPAGVGRIALAHQGNTFGTIDLSLCRTCQTALVLALDVAEEHRQMGIGRVLVSAARARCEDYTVTMTWPRTSPVATLFWSRVGLLGGALRPCRHQLEAGIDGGDSWEGAAYRANSDSHSRR
ncbi:hypothetical protein BS329_38620 [Amycolatopsis coloradensis]|uniref:N-acetyltransferase domain-containing protein n=1 Tax=Amycolatopsis coloradensis TaxID=76021 RepID=A0A1R0KEJ9_9PSEU|nr:hypothetical protein [Amycolatopsis coloradensis]OLZ43574.1 hypothetical protein BS329_38620 [Amycolatopsis coloradensis]